MATRPFPLGDLFYTPVFNTQLNPVPLTFNIVGEANGSSPEEITYTFTFDKSITGFDTSDITVTGGSKGDFSVLSTTTFTLVVNIDEGATELVLNVAASSAVDAAGNANVGAISTLMIDGTPQIQDAGAALAYYEGDGAQIIDSDLTLSDQNNGSLVSAVIQITDNFLMGEDVLGFIDTFAITGSYDDATGQLTLTGSDSVENYKLALESITYTNTDEDNPNTNARTVSWTVNDGGVDSLVATSTINVMGVNDAPELVFPISFTVRNVAVENDIGYPYALNFAVDVEGDGDIDLISATRGDGIVDDTVTLYRNDGNENFNAEVIGTSSDYVSSAFVEDVNGDGDVDIILNIQGYSGGEIRWYENDGSDFIPHDIFTGGEGGYNSSVFAIDIGDDEDIDIISTHPNFDLIVIHENDGDENFDSSPITNSADGVQSVFAIDIDDDGDIDILSADYNSDSIRWYENTSSGFFSHTITSSADGAYDVYAIDIDDDGDIDVLSASALDDSIRWYENDGNEGFSTHLISNSSDRPYTVYAEDIDDDGDIDVLSNSVGDNSLTWYENDGFENFTTRHIAYGDYAGSVFAIDIDGDDDIDILGGSNNNRSINWYENNPFSAHVDGKDNSSVIFDVGVIDVDNESHTYSLTGADAAAFVIDAAGVVTAAGVGLDNGIQESYSFNIVVSDGELTDSQAVTVIALDKAPEAPTIASASNVALDSDIVLDFSENIALGSGHITFYNASETISINVVSDASLLSIVGNQLTINPAADLLYPGSTYSVLLDPGAIVNFDSGNYHPGIASNGELTFTTESNLDSIVVFDLTTVGAGATSNHSGRTFSAALDYTIFIVVDSDSEILHNVDSSARWKGVENLGSGDQVILVGDGSAIIGGQGGGITSVLDGGMTMSGYYYHGPEWNTNTVFESGTRAAKLGTVDSIPAFFRTYSSEGSFEFLFKSVPVSLGSAAFAAVSNGGFLTVLPESIPTTGITAG